MIGTARVKGKIINERVACVLSCCLKDNVYKNKMYTTNLQTCNSINLINPYKNTCNGAGKSHELYHALFINDRFIPLLNQKLKLLRKRGKIYIHLKLKECTHSTHIMYDASSHMLVGCWILLPRFYYFIYATWWHSFTHTYIFINKCFYIIYWRINLNMYFSR